MSTIEEILKSKKKTKETVELLAEAFKRDKKLIDEIIQCFKDGTTAEKGNCMEAIEYVTKENPEFAEDCLDFVIEHINDKAPRVKWEIAESKRQGKGILGIRLKGSYGAVPDGIPSNAVGDWQPDKFAGWIEWAYKQSLKGESK